MLINTTAKVATKTRMEIILVLGFIFVLGSIEVHIKLITINRNFLRIYWDNKDEKRFT